MERLMNQLTNSLLKRATNLVGAAVVAAIVMTAGAAPASADQWSKTYQVNGHATLQVSTGDGDVIVTGTDQKQIDARVTTNGWKIGPNDVQIIESQNGDNVSIEVKVPHWNFSLFGSGHKGIKVEVSVPRELNLNVRTSDGNVNAQGVTGKIQFDTGDGNVTASNIKGDIRIHTGDGHIEGHNFDGTLDADTGDGNLRIDGRFDALALKTGDGSIEAQAGSGSKVANGWNLHSGDGHITLRVPGDLNANLDAHTGDGSITLDVPIQVSGSLSHSSVRGKLNAGGPTLAISSGDGSIHIEKL
jgi:Putative adhesin